MNQDLYPMIFKRKSFHHFRGVGDEKLTEDELRDIERAWVSFEPLYPEIRTELRVVPAQKVNFKRDAEYCLMLYSEAKENYLTNAGYLGEQLDLFLVSRGIGTLWYGIGKPDEPRFEGLDYVIMLAIRKVGDGAQFRKDMFKAKRKELSETWSGDTLGVAEIARFAPSACNSQPWFVQNEGGALTVFRRKKPGRVGLMPPAMAAYFNRIDMGIYLCFLELCLQEKGLPFTRELFPDGSDEPERAKLAVYRMAE